MQQWWRSGYHYCTASFNKTYANLNLAQSLLEVCNDEKLWQWSRLEINLNANCVKTVRIRSFFDPHFPTFELNTEIYSLNLCIQSKCGKIWTRKTPNTNTFHVVAFLEWTIPKKQLVIIINTIIIMNCYADDCEELKLLVVDKLVKIYCLPLFVKMRWHCVICNK